MSVQIEELQQLDIDVEQIVELFFVGLPAAQPALLVSVVGGRECGDVLDGEGGALDASHWAVDGGG